MYENACASNRQISEVVVMKRFCLLSIAAAAHGFVVQPLAPVRMAPALGTAPIAAPLPLALRTAVPQQPRVHSAPAMGLFGLGTPELAVIAAVALLVLGPEQASVPTAQRHSTRHRPARAAPAPALTPFPLAQMKKFAKDIGKVSAELKQVPEEFNKGMAAGTEELEARKPPTEGAEGGSDDAA